jgi:hypothetical protein
VAGCMATAGLDERQLRAQSLLSLLATAELDGPAGPWREDPGVAAPTAEHARCSLCPAHAQLAGSCAVCYCAAPLAIDYRSYGTGWGGQKGQSLRLMTAVQQEQKRGEMGPVLTRMGADLEDLVAAQLMVDGEAVANVCCKVSDNKASSLRKRTQWRSTTRSLTF